jgi:phosphoglycerate dehydrogenase-like enzyme
MAYKKWKVVYMEAVPQDTADIITSRLPDGFELEIVPDYSDGAARRALATADFVLVATRPLPASLIEVASRLRMIQHQGVGHEKTDVRAAARRGIPVALCPEGTIIGVAEHTILLILAIYKQLVRADRSMREGEWLQFSLRSDSFEIAGKTLGLVGFGRIGEAVAERARAFNAQVVYYDILRRDEEEERHLGVRYLPLDKLLAVSDIVSLHLPVTPESHHLINAETIRLMKRGAILINTSRGALVDEGILVEALESGQLGGAGLDVFETEPPDAKNALLKIGNVVLTPHISAGTRDALVAKMDAAFANLVRVTEGKQPLHVVQLEDVET